MEYHTNKDAVVAIRIFELGLKQFSEDVDYVIKYLQFLLSINDDNSAFHFTCLIPANIYSLYRRSSSL